MNFSHKHFLTIISAAAVFLITAAEIFSQVMITPEDLFKAEFPGSVMERKKVYIKKESLALLEKKSGAKFKSRMFTFHKAVKNGKIQGYAAFDSHRVRTKEETICILFTPDGMIQKILIVSFFEPGEYLPSARWLKQFENKKNPDSLRTGNGIVSMSGATLTTNSVVRSVRKWLVVFQHGIGS